MISYRVTPHVTTKAAPAQILQRQAGRIELDRLHLDISKTLRKNQESGKNR